MIEIREEKVADIENEIGILFEHYNEVNGTDALIVNVELAKQYEKLGFLLLMVAREVGKIVGYTFNVVMPHPRHALIMSDCKALYIKPGKRGFLSFNLMKQTEDALKARGVTLALQSYREKNNIEPFLKAFGYEKVMTVSQKRFS